MGIMAEGRTRRIGLVLVRPDIEGDLLEGVTAAAAEAGLDVVCFGGGYLAHKWPGHAVYSLAGEVPLDGVIVCTAMATGVFEDEIRALCARYADVPVVTGALGLPEYPSVAAESYSGVYDVVSHLIEVHGCRRIAHIEGPPGQSEAAERFRAYRTALEDHGLLFAPEFVVTGDFTVESGVAAMQMLFDRFWTEGTGLALDAVVASNDEMAVGAHQVMTERGLRLPWDVALVGFDDAEDGWSLVPSLTTVRQLREVVGRQMVEMMLRLLEDAPVAEADSVHGADPALRRVVGLHRVPSEVVLRRSCGCLPLAVTRAAILDKDPIVDGLASAEWEQAVDSALWLALRRGLGVDAASDAEETPRDFLMVVDEQLRDLYASSGDSEWFQDKLSLLRHRCVDAPASEALSPAQVAQAEDLLHQARVLTGDMGRRIEAAQAGREARQAELLRALKSEVSSVIDLPGLLAPLAMFLPGSHVRELYVVVQVGHNGEGERLPPGPESGEWRMPEFSRQRRLILRYRDGKAEVTDIRFTAPYLLPNLADPPISPVLITMPLVFRDRLFGYMVISHVEGAQPIGSQKSKNVIYQRIAEELSSVLYRVELVAEAETARLQAEVSLAEIRRTREIADRVRRAPDAEALMRVALEELSEVLGASRAFVRLGTRTTALGEALVKPAPSGPPNGADNDV
jgi:DNA-binding LacI/PurR family transcriptional regulator